MNKNDVRNYVAKRILFHLFDKDQDLALKVSRTAEEIAARCNASLVGAVPIDEDQIRLLVDPWVKHALKDTSH